MGPYFILTAAAIVSLLLHRCQLSTSFSLLPSQHKIFSSGQLQHQSSPTISSLFSSVIRHLDDDNMRELLFFPPPDSPAVLVDAYTQWCGPCKVIEPLINQIATKYINQISVLKYDVEGPKNELLKVEMLLQNIRVSGLPTLILYWRGKPVAMHSGVITEEGLEDWLDKNLFSNEALLVDGEADGNSNNDAIVKKAKGDAAGDDEEDSTATAGKRGFVSFASQYGRDDYAL